MGKVYDSVMDWIHIRTYCRILVILSNRCLLIDSFDTVCNTFSYVVVYFLCDIDTSRNISLLIEEDEDV